MKLLHKTSALSFYMIHTGFMAFKARIREILNATSDTNLEDMVDDDALHAFYRSGESPEFVAATLCDWSYQD
ncbi:MAG: hypothetical protein MJY87_03145 [Fibrobacter sp.]|nr:hypothetical protein [Fibrobacter sp.]